MKKKEWRLTGRRGWFAGAALAAGLVVWLGLGDSEGDSYFPLSSGWSWHYRMDVRSDDGRSWILKDTVTNLKPAMVQAGEAVPRRTATGNTYFYAAEAGGVRRLAYELSGETGLIEPPVQWLFKLPAENGDQWTIETQSFLLVGRMPPFIGVRPEEAVTLTMQTVSTGDQVRTPSGVYGNCLKVHGTGAFSFIGDTRAPPVNVTVEQTDWYAPGIGLVKSVRRENSDSPLFGKITLSRVLEQFDKGFGLL